MSDPQVAVKPQKFSETTEELFIRFFKTEDSRIRDELILRHLDLVKKLASRFVSRSKSLESSVSVGTIGLINAVDRFDINKGVKFTTYATSYILGEIEHYFRDNGWFLKVPRRLKKLNGIVQNTIEGLITSAGRSPTITEIAAKLDMPSEIIVEVLEAGRAYKPISLDQEFSFEDGNNTCLLDVLNQSDDEFRKLSTKIDIKKAMHRLGRREKMIIHLFYFKEFSQAEIAQRLRISQMHVSRLLGQAIKNLKRLMTGYHSTDQTPTSSLKHMLGGRK